MENIEIDTKTYIIFLLSCYSLPNQWACSAAVHSSQQKWAVADKLSQQPNTIIYYILLTREQPFIKLSHGRDNEVECIILILYTILRERNVSPRVDTTQTLLYQIEAEISLIISLQIA